MSYSLILGKSIYINIKFFKTKLIEHTKFKRNVFFIELWSINVWQICADNSNRDRDSNWELTVAKFHILGQNDKKTFIETWPTSTLRMRLHFPAIEPWQQPRHELSLRWPPHVLLLPANGQYWLLRVASTLGLSLRFCRRRNLSEELSILQPKKKLLA